MKEERFSPLRVLYMIASLVICLGECIYLCLRQTLEIKNMISFIIIALLLTLNIFLLVITSRRSEEGFFQGTSYRNLFLLLVVSWMIIDLSHYLPPFFFPAGLIIAILACGLPGTTAMAMGTCMVLLLCITGMPPHAVTYAYVFEALFAAMLCEYMRKTDFRHRVLPALMMVLSTFFIQVVFYYYTYQELTIRNMIYSGCGALVTGIFVGVFLPLISDVLSRERFAFYDTILDEEFPLLVELKEYSTVEYAHALRVCELSRDCALDIGADANLAASGGLYYRIGKIYGEPEIDNAIVAAHRYNFPRELVSIIYESEGALRNPTSIESAIVLMADCVVRKIDVIRNQSDSMDSNWNQNMLIYQTLNDLANKGLFDNSGLGINGFLRIREHLVREEKLL